MLRSSKGVAMLALVWSFLAAGADAALLIPPSWTERAFDASRPLGALATERLPPGPMVQSASLSGSPTFSVQVDRPSRDQGSGSDGWTIEVVDAAGRAIAHADVTIAVWEPNAQNRRREMAEPWFGERPPWWRGRTAEDGRVRIPTHSLTPVLVTARADGLSGHRSLAKGWSESTLRLELLPPREVQIEVVDQGEQPVPGVLVSIAMPTVDADPIMARTDEVGVARLVLEAAQIQLGRSKRLRYWVERPTGELQLADAVTWADAGPTRARFVLASAGRVVLTIVDEHGQVVPGEHRLTIGRPQPDTGTWASPLNALAMELRGRRFKGPTVEIAGLHGDSSFEVTLRTRGRSPVRVQYSIPPTGETRAFQLTQGALLPVLSLQLLGADGAPWAQRDLLCELVYTEVLESESGVPQSASAQRLEALLRKMRGEEFELHPARTDAMGRIQLSVRVGHASELRIHAQRWPAHAPRVLPSGDQRAPIEGAPLLRIAIPPMAAGERRGFEALQVPDRPLIAGGRVVDHRGQPIAGARVTVIDRSDFDPGSEIEVSPDSASWLPQREFGCFSDAVGRFEIRGVGPWIRPQLAASLGQMRSLPIAWEPGMGDLVLVIAEPGAIAGRVEWDLLSEAAVLVRAWREDAPSPDLDLQSWVSVKADGSFAIEDLAPGQYTLVGQARDRNSVGGSGRTIFQVTAVRVQPAEISADPRLQGIAPPRRWEWAKVVVQDAEGQPLAGVRVQMRYASGYRGETVAAAHTNERGSCSFLRRETEPSHISLQVPGFLPIWRASAEFPLELRLDRGATLIATIPGLRALVEAEPGHAGFALAVLPKAPRLDLFLTLTEKVNAKYEGTGVTLEDWQRHGELEAGREVVAYSGLLPGRYEVFLRLLAVRPDLAGLHPARGFEEETGGALRRGYVRIGEVEVSEDQLRIERRFALSAEALSALRALSKNRAK